MNTLEISTITILHTLSTLTKKDLELLGTIAGSTKSGMSPKTAPSEEMDISSADDQLQVLMKKFNVQSLQDLRAILNEINFLSMLKETSKLEPKE